MACEHTLSFPSRLQHDEFLDDESYSGFRCRQQTFLPFMHFLIHIHIFASYKVALYILANMSNVAFLGLPIAVYPRYADGKGLSFG